MTGVVATGDDIPVELDECDGWREVLDRRLHTSNTIKRMPTDVRIARRVRIRNHSMAIPVSSRLDRRAEPIQ